MKEKRRKGEGHAHRGGSIAHHGWISNIPVNRPAQVISERLHW